MKALSIIYQGVILTLCIILTASVLYAWKEARFENPRPEFFWVFVFCLTTLCLLASKKHEVLSGSWIFYEPEENHEWYDYITWPVRMIIGLLMWAVANVINFMLVVCLYSGGFSLTAAYMWFTGDTTLPIPHIIGWGMVGAAVLFLLAQLGNKLGMRGKAQEAH